MSEPTTDELLDQVSAVMRYIGSKGKWEEWCARVHGTTQYHHGATPREAMMKAVAAFRATQGRSFDDDPL